MGVHVIALYRPKPGQQAAVEAETAAHVTTLRRLGLATDHPALVLRASDGTVMEQFEWTDQAAIDAAHSHPEVLAMWERYGAAADYITLADLPNAASMFPEFELIGIY